MLTFCLPAARLKMEGSNARACCCKAATAASDDTGAASAWVPASRRFQGSRTLRLIASLDDAIVARRLQVEVVGRPRHVSET
jgi:hypothetical protein